MKINKAVEIKAQSVTENDLEKINQFTLEPLTADDVYIFKAVIGDNETDDRNFEPFNLNALKDLSELYIGKTVIKDHDRSADNQIARVYDTELVTEDRKTTAGEPYTKLIAKAYMLRTESNADLIREIQAGIKKEVSTGMMPKKVICSICGQDNMEHYCDHYAGRKYDGEVCLMILDGASEAYELSLVAVPAQPRAGTVKSYKEEIEETEETEEETLEEENPEDQEENSDDQEENPDDQDKPEEDPEEKSVTEELDINLRVRLSDSFLFTNLFDERS